jgi:acetate kinase
MGAAIDGLDALVFTGGVGENSAPLRQRAAEGHGFLEVGLDPELNCEPLAIAGSAARVLSFAIVPGTSSVPSHPGAPATN